MLPLKKTVPPLRIAFTVPPYGRAVYHKYRDGYSQLPPYNIDTSLYFETGTSDGNVSSDAWDWRLGDPRWGNFPKEVVAADNRAYKSLIGKLGDSSSFGATLIAERKQTFGLVVGTIVKAGLAARAVRRWDFGGAARLLGIPYGERTVTTRRFTHRKDGSIRRTIVKRKRVMTLPTGREVSKTLANGWLMYSYGIKPLMGDTYNAMDVLQRPFPWDRVRGSGQGASSNGWFLTGTYVSIKRREMQVSVRCSAEVSVENPNLFLMNRMGLVNPVAIANEAIPFSFVVDWFSNLSDVIGASTDFVGLAVRKQTTTKKFTQLETTFNSGPFGRDPYSTSKSRVTITRESGIVSPKLQFSFERFQWQRGLNAISLLIQLLPRR